ncbi:hypothetical protein O3Q52_16760 [Streptomyces sp. ActVer]|uniref:hypothetical protein n=1 Tax=Streptomyces sp. ActVer TaxID=3014558 RepID=UPI0022B3DA02|nr:hypothetical protein [Streptomyces sp. ActVer]MCZ4509818.1 hypothetical protein [Streptomyces sp. ActVer]
MMYACELRPADVDVVVEQLVQWTGELRAGGMHSHTLEVLDRRQVLDRFLAAGELAPVGHFFWLLPARARRRELRRIRSRGGGPLRHSRFVRRPSPVTGKDAATWSCPDPEPKWPVCQGFGSSWMTSPPPLAPPLERSGSTSG